MATLASWGTCSFTVNATIDADYLGTLVPILPSNFDSPIFDTKACPRWCADRPECAHAVVAPVDDYCPLAFPNRPVVCLLLSNQTRPTHANVTDQTRPRWRDELQCDTSRCRPGAAPWLEGLTHGWDNSKNCSTTGAFVATKEACHEQDTPTPELHAGCLFSAPAPVYSDDLMDMARYDLWPQQDVATQAECYQRCVATRDSEGCAGFVWFDEATEYICSAVNENAPWRHAPCMLQVPYDNTRELVESARALHEPQ